MALLKIHLQAGDATTDMVYFQIKKTPYSEGLQSRSALEADRLADSGPAGSSFRKDALQG